MKLLYLAHRVPCPPDKGDKIRSLHQLRELARRGHEVHLLAFADRPEDAGRGEELLRFCASAGIVRLDRRAGAAGAALSLVAGRPFSTGFFHSRRMAKAVERLLAAVAFDGVVAYSAVMGQYVPGELAGRGVMDMVDVDSRKWLDYSGTMSGPASWVCRLESERLAGFEASMVGRFGRTLLATEREAEALRGLIEPEFRSRISVVGNGVDLDYFGFRAEQPEGGIERLVFTGAMDYHANVDGVGWFAREAFPIIRASRPAAVFQIVGSRPAAAVRRLAGIDGVEVTGYVDDVRPYLRGAAVGVIPLRLARGIQNKVLESMAAGVPLVVTPEPAAGLGAVDGVDLIVRSGAREFAGAVAGLLGDPGARAGLALSARRFVERHHSWEPALVRMAEIVEGAANGKP